VATACGAVRAIDLDHGDVLAAQVSADSDAVGAIALHPGTLQHPEAARPGQQLPVAGRGGREGRVGNLCAQGGDDRSDVDILVGVYPENDLLAAWAGVTALIVVGHAGHGCSSFAMV
jgi:hypothetical protein